jgi:flagellar hook assembly protein FlgD
MPVAGTARLVVYNVLGQEMVTLLHGWRQAGRAQVVWDGKDRAGNPAAAGLYLVRFTVTDPDGAQRFSQGRKIALLR